MLDGEGPVLYFTTLSQLLRSYSFSGSIRVIRATNICGMKDANSKFNVLFSGVTFHLNYEFFQHYFKFQFRNVPCL